MGGTSTDVSRYDGNFKHSFESVVEGSVLTTPQLEIVTVAAGGGSKLIFERGLFVVGPESVGSFPGPICYRNSGGSLAVTDANLFLGRIVPDYFPKIFGPNQDLSLDYKTVHDSLEKLTLKINKENKLNLLPEQVALGFIRVANESMIKPIRALTESRGISPSEHVLCAFGGAGSQHACSIAKSLGIKTVSIHRHSSVLSAVGIAMADVIEESKTPIMKKIDEYS